MKYRTEIDGLRALAVLPVIFFHAKVPFFDGGFVGVDIFFVISGYLISGIIMDDLDKGRFSLGNFYERRARRILPALFFVIFISILFAFFLLAPRFLEQFSKSASATLFFISNFFFADKIDYFTDIDFIPLLHTWSLAVEEQFYLFFPLCLMLFWRFSKKVIFFSLLLIFIVSLGLAQWSSENAPTDGFYLLHTRIWELLAGVFVTFYFRYSKFTFGQAIKQAGSILGLLLIVASVLVLDRAFPFPSVFTLFPVVGTMLIILFANDKGFVNYILSLKPLVGIGLISYSAYLWHQPVLVFARHGYPEGATIFVSLILCLIIFVLAYISWRFIEKPFRHKKSKGAFTISRARMITYLSSFAGIMLIFTAYADISEGIKWRPHANFEGEDWRPETPENCILNARDSEPDIFRSECQTEKDIILWGNSHAGSLKHGLSKYFDSPYFYSKCGAALDVGLVEYKFRDCTTTSNETVFSHDNAIIEQIPKNQPKFIILHSYWAIIEENFLIHGISKTLDVLAETTSAEIIVVGGVHSWQNRYLYYRSFRDLDFKNVTGPVYTKVNTERIKKYDELLQKIVVEKNNNRIQFVSALDILCRDDSECILAVYEGGKAAPIFTDGNHFTWGGAVFFVKRLLPYLE